jgi:multidrug resistance efflux pump
MPTYEPIPTPPSQRWREFRMRALPFMVFVCSLVGAIFMWRSTINAPTLVGEVEGRQAWVTSREVGVVTNLLVERFDRVTNGQPVALVVSMDPRTQSSNAQDLRSRISLSQLEINSIIDRERIAFDYQNLSMDTLRFRAQLAAVRAQLPTAQTTLARNKKGVEEQVISINEYELSLGLRDSLKAEADELQRLVDESEQRLSQSSRLAATFTNSMSDNSLEDALGRLRDERRQTQELQSEPTILLAPIDGIVGSILRRPGENVVAGDIIMTIHSLEGDRIVGYLRQPLPFTPKKGMPVKVRCRTMQREEAMSEIAQISPRYEPITNLSLLRPGFLYEIGMPVSIAIPPELRPTLAPGELVDLAISP